MGRHRCWKCRWKRRWLWSRRACWCCRSERRRKWRWCACWARPCVANGVPFEPTTLRPFPTLVLDARPTRLRARRPWCHVCCTVRWWLMGGPWCGWWRWCWCGCRRWARWGTHTYAHLSCWALLVDLLMRCAQSEPLPMLHRARTACGAARRPWPPLRFALGGAALRVTIAILDLPHRQQSAIARIQ